MTTYNLDLVFLGDPKSPDLPTAPRMYIGLKCWSTHDGIPLITSECVSIIELEGQIRLIQQDLEAVLAEAKKRFAAYDKIQGRHLAERIEKRRKASR